MAARKKAAKKTAAAKPQPATGGVAVKTDQPIRRDGGVPVRVPDVPAQTAGPEHGQSAGNEGEN